MLGPATTGATVPQVQGPTGKHLLLTLPKLLVVCMYLAQLIIRVSRHTLMMLQHNASGLRPLHMAGTAIHKTRATKQQCRDSSALVCRLPYSDALCSLWPSSVDAIPKSAAPGTRCCQKQDDMQALTPSNSVGVASQYDQHTLTNFKPGCVTNHNLLHT